MIELAGCQRVQLPTAGHVQLAAHLLQRSYCRRSQHAHRVSFTLEAGRSLPARFHDALVGADIPIIFTTNKRPKQLVPRLPLVFQRRAIKRRFTAIKVTQSLMHLGRPLTSIEKRARRAAGRYGPQGPGVRMRQSAISLVMIRVRKTLVCHQSSRKRLDHRVSTNS